MAPELEIVSPFPVGDVPISLTISLADKLLAFITPEEALASSKIYVPLPLSLTGAKEYLPESISNNRNFPVGSPLLSTSLITSPSLRPLSGSYVQLNSAAAVLPK